MSDPPYEEEDIRMLQDSPDMPVMLSIKGFEKTLFPQPNKQFLQADPNHGKFPSIPTSEKVTTVQKIPRVPQIEPRRRHVAPPPKHEPPVEHERRQRRCRERVQVEYVDEPRQFAEEMQNRPMLPQSATEEMLIDMKRTLLNERWEQSKKDKVKQRSPSPMSYLRQQAVDNALRSTSYVVSPTPYDAYSPTDSELGNYEPDPPSYMPRPPDNARIIGSTRRPAPSSFLPRPPNSMVHQPAPPSYAPCPPPAPRNGSSARRPAPSYARLQADGSSTENVSKTHRLRQTAMLTIADVEEQRRQAQTPCGDSREYMSHSLSTPGKYDANTFGSGFGSTTKENKHKDKPGYDPYLGMVVRPTTAAAENTNPCERVQKPQIFPVPPTRFNEPRNSLTAILATRPAGFRSRQNRENEARAAASSSSTVNGSRGNAPVQTGTGGQYNTHGMRGHQAPRGHEEGRDPGWTRPSRYAH